MGARLGLIVNPIAGMGGRVGLKGTDGADILREARARGAEPVASGRAVTALAALAERGSDIEILCFDGAMGADAAKAVGLTPTVIGEPAGPETSGDDTKRAAQALADQDCDLILFAGGDGTARDILSIVELAVPILGIPTGVKMHSAVFAVGPASAGRLATNYVLAAHGRIALREAEVMDIDEAAQRENRLSARLYGYARVPFERLVVQSAKVGTRADDDAELAALGAEIAREMAPDTLYVIGPGRSAKRVLDALSAEGTLLGVDLVRDGAVVARDVSEAEILRVAADAPVRIVVGVIGGQGFVFGRGNQQISARVIERAGPDGITIMAGASKLAALAPARLMVDTGDTAMDARLAGYRRIATAPGRFTMMQLCPV